jgi:dipeptidyl aminopeptidase/acylaminoacyl peptidase
VSPRARVLALVVVVVAVVAGTAIYLVHAHRRQEGSAPSAEVKSLALVPVAQLERVPRIVFRNTALGADYGRVAMAALADPGGARAVTSVKCDRVDAHGPELLCLQAHSTITSSYTTLVLNGSHRLLSTSRPGIPSRARFSPDGTLAATTAFVAGDSYTDSSFSTRTWITPVKTGRGLHLEDFDLVHDGRHIKPVDRNYWGVTFLDEDAFYATVSFSGHTWLVRGSVRDRTVQTVHATAECPSVAPGHTEVAYKKRQANGEWRVAVLDVASDKERLLPGSRSVDDQVAWLDDDTLIYALPRTGAHSGEFDVWAVAADGSTEPRLLIPLASSPDVVR